jgi:2-polyprenyl-3-methyl-5-hydroxy-6-metoxy-1,4-benzoquinol methylase
VAEIADKARSRLDKVIVGGIEEQPGLPDGYFDCIVFNDVLEHLVDPWTVLRSIKVKLKSGGCVVASIPNVRHFSNLRQLILEKEWRYMDCGVLDRTHLRFFTEKSIRRMFEDCGYNLCSIDGIVERPFPWTLGLLNRILFNSLRDTEYLQFACVATVAKTTG